MDPGSPLLEDLDIDGFLFGSQDKQFSMDLDKLDAAHTGASLPELDQGRFDLHLQPSLGRYPGKSSRADLVLRYLPHTVHACSARSLLGA